MLGSMPGAASLQAGCYYAHPRNAFWPLWAALGGAPATAPLAERLAGLQALGVALWDVVASCERAGSLDGAIRRDSVVVNDFRALFAACPRLAVVACNGATAHDLFRRHVAGRLPPRPDPLPVLRLPSTSPAHAGSSLPAKIAAWRAALQVWLAARPDSGSC